MLTWEDRLIILFACYTVYSIQPLVIMISCSFLFSEGGTGDIWFFPICCCSNATIRLLLPSNSLHHFRTGSGPEFHRLFVGQYLLDDALLATDHPQLPAVHHTLPAHTSGAVGGQDINISLGGGGWRCDVLVPSHQLCSQARAKMPRWPHHRGYALHIILNRCRPRLHYPGDYNW